MIDPGNRLNATFQFILHIQLFQEGTGTNLHTVAQTDSIDAGVTLHIAGKDRHRIRIVHE